MTELDTLSGLEMHTKRVAESLLYDFVFTNLAEGETLATIDSVSQINRGTVTGSTNLTMGAPAHDADSTAQVKLSGGTDKESYCLTVLATTSTGLERTCSGVLFIKEACS